MEVKENAREGLKFDTDLTNTQGITDGKNKNDSAANGDGDSKQDE